MAELDTPRFLSRDQVAEELNISMAQCYALIRRGELRAAKIGGRGDYRIGRQPVLVDAHLDVRALDGWVDAVAVVPLI